MQIRITTLSLLLTSLFLTAVVRAESPEKKEKAAILNERGISALNKNDYAGAIECFQRAHDLMPENKIIRNNLAVTYNNYAIVLNKQGKTEDPKEFLYNAIKLDNDNSSYKTNLANILSNISAEQYKDGNYNLAIQGLKEALALVPKHVPSLILLGHIYYQTQDLANAEEIWQRAYNYDPRNSELRQMLKKLRDEKKIETGLKQLDAYYFDIRFDKEAIDSEIYDVKYYLQEAYRDVGRDFGYYPQHTLPVILYAQEDFHKLRQAPEWIAGLYDGKIRLPVRKNAISETEFKRLIWHEYTHAVIFDLTEGKCPVWFNEGLAKYEELKIEKSDMSALSKALKENTLIPLNKLNSAFTDKMDPARLNLAYLEAYSFIDFLLDRWNFHIIKSILVDLKQNKSLDEAFPEETDRDIQRLNNEWKEYLKRNY